MTKIFLLLCFSGFNFIHAQPEQRASGSSGAGRYAARPAQASHKSQVTGHKSEADIGGLAQNGAVEVLSLEESVKLALQNSLPVLSAEQEILIAKQRLKEAHFLYLPQITISATLSRLNLEYPMVLPVEFGGRFLENGTNENFYTLRGYVFQPLYAGGRNKSTLKMAKAALNSAEVSHEMVKRDVILNAKKTFYAFLFQKKNYEMLAGWHQKALNISEKINNKNRWESVESVAILSRFDFKKSVGAKNIENSKLDFLAALNKETDSAVDIAGEFETAGSGIDIRQSLVSAMEMRPEQKSEMYKAQMDDIAVNMAIIRRYPNIYLGLNYDIVAEDISGFSNSSLRSNNWVASIAVHLPLSYDIWSDIVRKKALQRQGDIKRSEVQDRIRFEIFKSHSDVQFWEKTSAKIKESFERANIEYESALKNESLSTASLRALVSVFELNKQYVDSVYNLSVAKVTLEWAQGTPVAQ
ncbi:MAG: TolC family protein [Elusimicrobia bacterium]|nr:TolC family protein [Elusimicrobiota bacterium]